MLSVAGRLVSTFEPKINELFQGNNLADGVWRKIYCFQHVSVQENFFQNATGRPIKCLQHAATDWQTALRMQSRK